MKDSLNGRAAGAMGDRVAGPSRNSYWLIENVLLAGRYPGAFNDDEAREKIERIAELRAATPDRERQSPESDAQCRYVCDWTGGGAPGA